MKCNETEHGSYVILQCKNSKSQVLTFSEKHICYVQRNKIVLLDNAMKQGMREYFICYSYSRTMEYVRSCMQCNAAAAHMLSLNAHWNEFVIVIITSCTLRCHSLRCIQQPFYILSLQCSTE